jgi:hypothetical protein
MDHERSNSGDKDLLYYFEKGESLRLKKDFAGSRDTWLKADEQVQVWENDARTDTEKYLKGALTIIANDKTSRYDGYDYEKVMLSTRLALDHIAVGDWAAVRTEIKKSHERESLIKELNEKKYAKVEEEAGKNRNVKTSYKSLQGYPVETLDDPDVENLRNGYQSAFSHYLAGFVYEALGEPGLAAPSSCAPTRRYWSKACAIWMRAYPGRAKPKARPTCCLWWSRAWRRHASPSPFRFR